MVARRNGRSRVADRRGRWLYPSAGAPAVDYLMTYSSNPLVVGASSGHETVVNANIDPRFFTGTWYVDLIPNWASTDSTLHYVFSAPSAVLGRIFWNTNNRFFIDSGTPLEVIGNAFPTFSAGDTLTLVIDFATSQSELLINSVSAGVTSITPDLAARSAEDWTVGATSSGAQHFNGSVYQPIAGLPPGSVL